MIKYIGIHGPKRVGKDEFAKNLSSAILASVKASVYIDRIADPLYVWASTISGWTIAELMGPKKDQPFTAENCKNPGLWGMSPRSILLDQGIFVREKYGMGFMSHCLRQRAERISYEGTLFVLVPDVRTEVEAQFMDVVFELSRAGCRYDGTITEHAFERLTVPVINIGLRTCDDTRDACDFDSAFTTLQTSLYRHHE